MGNDFEWNVLKNDDLKKKLTKNLEKCEIKVGQLEIMVLESSCNFEHKTDEPDIVTIRRPISSSNFPDQTIKDAIAVLKDGLEGIKIQANMKIDTGEIQKNLDSFQKALHKFIVCMPKVSEAERQSLLFIIVQLGEKDMQQYKEIFEYILGEMSVSIEKIDVLQSFLSSDFFAKKMPNRGTLFGNYVDDFLQKNALPLAEVLTELSAEKYEGSESEARIYVDCSGVIDLVIFDKIGQESRIINSDNRRMIRKLMEISKEGVVHLYAKREEEEGRKYCRITKLVKGEQDKGLYIKFFGYLCWGIVWDGTEKIIYERGRYLLNSSENKKDYLVKIEELKNKIEAEAPDELMEFFRLGSIQKLTEILQKQKHGAVAILTNCKKHVEQLCNLNRGIFVGEDLGICYESNNWNKEQLLSLTGIDGAVFIDLDGTCIAFGVIVDGEAKMKGDTGKGARYNSVVNYVRQKEKDYIYLGIIVSEDGMVELTCNFEPEDPD